MTYLPTSMPPLHFEEELPDDTEFCWMLYYPQDGVGAQHIMPSGDLYEHQSTPECWCHPEEDLNEDDDVVFYHNAADNREEYQDGRRRPH